MKIGNVEIKIDPVFVILISGALLMLGVATLTAKNMSTEIVRQNQETRAYLEKLGTGRVLGKTHNERKYEVAIQFKDTIFYVGNKEYYYLLEKGDSIEVKNGKILIK